MLNRVQSHLTQYLKVCTRVNDCIVHNLIIFCVSTLCSKLSHQGITVMRNVKMTSTLQISLSHCAVLIYTLMKRIHNPVEPTIHHDHKLLFRSPFILATYSSSCDPTPIFSFPHHLSNITGLISGLFTALTFGIIYSLTKGENGLDQEEKASPFLNKFCQSVVESLILLSIKFGRK